MLKAIRLDRIEYESHICMKPTQRFFLTTKSMHFSSKAEPKDTIAMDITATKATILKLETTEGPKTFLNILYRCVMYTFNNNTQGIDVEDT